MRALISRYTVWLVVAGVAAATPARGALRVHPENPRWLTEDGGKTAIVLTGGHTWSVFQDYERAPRFDAVSYLDGIAGEGHNFTRGWFWEDGFYTPLPYEKEGGRYRLSAPYNREYLTRLRSRIRAARERGLYVSVMLFQGWSMGDQRGQRRPDPWPRNPYNRDNHRERVSKQHAALHIGQAQTQQLEYVSYLAGKLCAEPNLIWEVSNESHPSSLGASNASNWQAAILSQIAQECRRRLTWVSCPATIKRTDAESEDLIERMFEMEADLVSPCDPGRRYTNDPPAADGRKVVIADSDHLDLFAVDAAWVWRAFLRGQHPIFMDLGVPLEWWSGQSWDPDDPRWAEVRAALGAVQELVTVVNRERATGPASGLAALVPQRAAGGQPGARTRPASSPYTLYSAKAPCRRKSDDAKCRKARANGDEVLAWAAIGEELTVCRLQAGADYRWRWKKIAAPGFEGPSLTASAEANGCLTLDAPSTDAVVHLERRLAS